MSSSYFDAEFSLYMNDFAYEDLNPSLVSNLNPFIAISEEVENKIF